MQREAWRAIGVGALSSKGLVVIRKRRRRRRRPPLLTPPRREKEKSAKIVCPKMDDVALGKIKDCAKAKGMVPGGHCNCRGPGEDALMGQAK